MVGWKFKFSMFPNFSVPITRNKTTGIIFKTQLPYVGILLTKIHVPKIRSDQQEENVEHLKADNTPNTIQN